MGSLLLLPGTFIIIRIFVENFYKILRMAKYTTGNSVGSYLFYSVEMGIPYFISGNSVPVKKNYGDYSYPSTYTSSIAPYNKIAIELFSENRGEITKEQLEFVTEEMGWKDCIGPRELNKILWRTFLKETIENIAKFFYRVFYYNLPVGLGNLIYLFRFNLRKEVSIVSNLTTTEKVKLHYFIRIMGAKCVALEIGSYLGGSTCFIANAVKLSRGTLYCMGTWENKTDIEADKNIFNKFVINTKNYSDVIIPLKTKSDLGSVLGELKSLEKNSRFTICQ